MGTISKAPNVQIILYPQYPEVRISGFLKGCKSAPSELIRMRQEGRILFFGIRHNGTVLGYVTAHDSPLANEIRAKEDLKQTGVFRELPLTEQADSKTIVLRELGRIHRRGWIQGKRISKRGVIGCNSSNAGGYTLEAELGILPNGFSEPDFLGWEVKQHTVSRFGSTAGRITLMTPEPTEGYYREEGAEAFVRRFGAPDRIGRADRLNFGGIHHVDRRCERTGLTMVIHGYDFEKKAITETGGGICLIADNQEIAAKWPFAGIIAHWNRKHGRAVYVPSMCRKENSARFYQYASIVRMGEGTDVLLLLDALLNGQVYYDPGIKLEDASTYPKLKRRSQFRIKSADISVLYKKMTSESVI
ncbi:MAG: MvaI/BcnI restriction endonuclease family protein [Deltaproteobacteria bacterium]|nr:MAG: MvaI/BcnI restriction endonuclease family protein [Deltaproteobacteria bacterium]